MESADRQAVDALRWPRIARIPQGSLLNRRAALVQKTFERLATQAEIRLGPLSSLIHSDVTTIQVASPVFYARLAESAWLGLGESYLASEWHSEDLPRLLHALLDTGLDAGVEGSVLRSLRRLGRVDKLLDAPDDGGELPTELLQLYAGELLWAGSGLFASGVRTTSREHIANQSRGAGRGGNPSHWLVDVTYVDAPKNVTRADLRQAQVRGVEHLLDMARVRAGDRVAEWPSAGGELAMRAADRGAGAQVVTVSDNHTEVIARRAEHEGLGGAIDVVQMSQSIVSPRSFPTDFEAVINVERLETFGRAGVVAWLRSAERLLVERGTIVVQMGVATEAFDEAARGALDLIRAYVWPQLHYLTMAEFRRLVDRETGLRIAAEEYVPAHWETTLRLQREVFAGNTRQAAGLGYDQVFRRMWDYSLALLQALVASGRLTMVQLELIHAPRRGA